MVTPPHINLIIPTGSAAVAWINRYLEEVRPEYAREASEDLPMRVEYSLTDRGQALNDALKPLGAWGREYLPARAVPVPVPRDS